MLGGSTEENNIRNVTECVKYIDRAHIKCSFGIPGATPHKVGEWPLCLSIVLIIAIVHEA